MSTKKALVVAGGECLALTTLVKMIKESSLVVAADSGAEHLLRAGRVPDAVIGDLDSCDKGIIDRIKDTKCEFIKLEEEKDLTDTEAAIDYCIRLGYENIDVTCAVEGKRLDHLFGNVFLLPKYTEKGIKVRLYDDGGRYLEVINDEIDIHGKVGTFVSLIPLAGEVIGVTTKGLKYELDNATLSQGNTLGISNKISSTPAKVTLVRGLLLVIREKDH
jgi:thiamine pyrophosphokinase